MQSEKTDDRVPTPPSKQPLDNETMAHPYSKYQDDLNAEAHVYAFLHTWEPNHVSQRLIDTKVERSKIMELGMTFEGPSTRWHAKHLHGSFATLKTLKDKFLRLFHRQVEQRELVGKIYTTYQEPNEAVP